MPSDDRLTRAERELFLRSFARAGTLDNSGALRMMSDAMTDAFYPAGSVIYQQGALPRYLYYVVTGRVKLWAEGVAPLYYDKSSAIGGLDMMQDIGYSRTAVAVEDTRTLLLPASKYMQVLEDNFEYARQMLMLLVGGVDALGAQLPLSELYRHDRGKLPELPAIHGRKLGLLERMMAVRQAPLVGGLRSQVLVGLAERLEERTVEVGAPVLPEGRRAESFWLIASGEIRATRKAPLYPAGASHVFQAGDGLVMFAAFADVEGQYAFAAEKPARLLGLRKDDFFDLLEDHGDVARVAMAYAARERSRINARLAELDLRPPPIASFSVPKP